MPRSTSYYTLYISTKYYNLYHCSMRYCHASIKILYNFDISIFHLDKTFYTSNKIFSPCCAIIKKFANKGISYSKKLKGISYSKKLVAKLVPIMGFQGWCTSIPANLDMPYRMYVDARFRHVHTMFMLICYHSTAIHRASLPL
jgi:hypothetical protein